MMEWKRNNNKKRCRNIEFESFEKCDRHKYVGLPAFCFTENNMMME